MEQKNLIPHSLNSVVLYKQQQDIYIQAAIQTRTPDVSVKVIKACYDPKIKDTSFSDIVKLVGNWRAVVGAIRDPDQDQIELEAKYLLNSHSDLSCLDVLNAIDFFIDGRLDIPLSDYVQFSILYMARVINSYLRYRGQVINRVSEIADKNILMLTQGDQTSKRIDGLKECISDCAAHAKEGFKERFFNQMVFDFLRKTRRLKIDKSLQESAKLYGEQKYFEDRTAIDQERKQKNHADTEKRMSEVLDLTPARVDDKKAAIRKYGIDYCLKHFFDNNDLDKILSGITEADFEPYNK